MFKVNKECEWNNDNENEENVSNGDYNNAVQQYKISYYYNDEIKKTYIYLNIIENETKCIIDEIICNIIKDYEFEHNNSPANDATNDEQNIQCDSKLHVYDYIKIDLMNLLDACRNNCDNYDDSLSLCNAAPDKILCDELENDSPTASTPSDKNDNISLNIINIKEDDTYKHKLNFNKIKNIVKKSEKERSNLTKNTSIYKKINNIVKKITNKIKVEFTKDVVSYANIIETYSSANKNSNIDDMLHVFYHLILDKINSKI
jgi:hypothetical protein